MITHINKDDAEYYLGRVKKAMTQASKLKDLEDVLVPDDVPLSAVWNEKMKYYMQFQSVFLDTSTVDFFDMVASGIRRLEEENAILQSRIDEMKHDYKLAQAVAEIKLELARDTANYIGSKPALAMGAITKLPKRKK